MEIENTNIPTCKHWAKRKTCFYGEKCRFSHPDDLIPTAPLVKVVCSGKQNHETRKQNRGPEKRNRVHNLGKARFFRYFLLDTFGIEVLKSGVLDIAGGQGELSYELVNLNGAKSTVIDPRPMKLVQYQKRLNFGMYWRNPIFEKYNTRSWEETKTTGSITPDHIRILFGDHLWSNKYTDEEKRNIFRQKAIMSMKIEWTEKGLIPTQSEPIEDSSLPDYDNIQNTLNGCRIIIGMHPDQAAEAIVDFALAKNIPFALTPCCTYSDEFPGRKLKSGNPVKTYEELIEYLVEKDPENILVKDLPFEGKNTVVYSNPYKFKL